MIVPMVSQSESKHVDEPSLSLHKEFNQPEDNQPTQDYEDNLDLAELETKKSRSKTDVDKFANDDMVFHLREWIIST